MTHPVYNSSAAIKIQGGTGKLTNSSLCRSCSFGHIFSTHEGEVVRCHVVSFNVVRMTKDVLECNQYRNAALPSLYQMEEIAWTLNTNKGGKTIGFEPPKKKKDD
jgi:hypothetical protein